MTGDLLIRATIALATIDYASAEWLRFRRPSAWRIGRAAWTIGAALAIGHAVAAFHFRHAWSHRDAYDTTALQTAAVIGLEWGGGLYVNRLRWWARCRAERRDWGSSPSL